MEQLGVIPYDEEIKRADATGDTVIDISNPTIGVKSIIQIGEQLLKKMR